MEFHAKRRDVLRGVAALGASQILCGIRVATAQQKAISATTFPGAWEEAHRQILLPVFRKATGAQVNLVASLAVDALSKIIAAKNNPPYDVAILDEGAYLAGLEHDIFAPLAIEKIPHLRDIPKKFVDGRGRSVHCATQLIGIAYNTEKIKSPPRSWNDLLMPEYKGRIGIAGMGTGLTIHWMVEMARINGGSEENMEPAFQFLKKLLPNLGAVTPSAGGLAALFQQGQIDLAVHYSNNVGDLQSKGVPIALARPDTGWALIFSTLHIIKNTKNPDLAAAYINAALSPEVQQKMAEAPYFLVPTNSKVPLSPGIRQYVRDTAALAAIHTVDWVKLAPRRSEYIDRFNREVKR